MVFIVAPYNNTVGPTPWKERKLKNPASIVGSTLVVTKTPASIVGSTLAVTKTPASIVGSTI